MSRSVNRESPPSLENGNSVAPGQRESHKRHSPSGILDAFPHEEVTPVIGREYSSDIQLSHWLKAKNSHDLIKELAYIGTSSFPAKGFSFYEALY